MDAITREDARQTDRDCRVGYYRSQTNVPVEFVKPYLSIERFTLLVEAFDFDYPDNEPSAYQRDLCRRLENEFLNHVAQFPEYAAIYAELRGDA